MFTCIHRVQDSGRPRCKKSQSLGGEGTWSFSLRISGSQSLKWFGSWFIIRVTLFFNFRNGASVLVKKMQVKLTGDRKGFSAQVGKGWEKKQQWAFRMQMKDSQRRDAQVVRESSRREFWMQRNAEEEKVGTSSSGGTVCQQRSSYGWLLFLKVMLPAGFQCYFAAVEVRNNLQS